MDEQEAIQRCLDGDKNAFGFLVQRYQPLILSICLRISGNREDAADLAQQTFVQAYRHLQQYDVHYAFRPWLCRIATNQCISFLRRRRPQAESVDPVELEAAVDDDGEVPTLAELAEDRERVQRAVAKLPAQYRTVLVAYYFQELRYQEIARQTGLPVGTIGTYLHRAKGLLRRMLTEEVDAHDMRRARTAPSLSGR